MNLKLQQCLIDSNEEGKIFEYERCKRIVYDKLKESNSQVERDCLKKVMERIILEKG